MLLHSDRATPSDGGVFLQRDRAMESTSRQPVVDCFATIFTAAQNFFGDDLASYRISSISCGICESPQQRKLLAIGFAAMMRPLSNYFVFLFLFSFLYFSFWFCVVEKLAYVSFRVHIKPVVSVILALTINPNCIIITFNPLTLTSKPNP